VFANFVSLALWSLTPMTLAILGALISIAFAVTAHLPNEEEDYGALLAEYAT